MARLPTPKQFLATKYMTRFSCLGPECEDNCCQWWLVAMEKDDYSKLRKTLTGTPEGTADFKQGVKRLRGDQKAEWYATIQHRDDGFCSFLSKEQTCSIHRDFGEKALCYTCAMYPRSVTLVGERIEMTASLSCPEIARQVLLVDDAMELVEIDPDVMPRKRTLGAIDLETDDPYYRYFDDVRATLLGLTVQTDHPVASRLFFVTYFANRLQPFFASRHPEFTEGALADEIDAMTQSEVLAELHQEFTGLTLPYEFSAVIVQQLLAARMHRGAHRRFVAMVRDLYYHYLVERAPEGADTETVWKVTMTAQEVWEQYRDRATYWDTVGGERIDQYLTNFCFNYWLKSWYTMSPTLLQHTRRLLITVAAFRFLLMGDPELRIVRADENASVEDRLAALDRSAVRAAYSLSRNIEHHQQFLRDLDASLNEHGFTSFAHIVCLLKV